MSNMVQTTLISTAVVASLPLIPVGHFLSFGWEERKQQIVTRFSDPSIEAYKVVFCPKRTFSTAQEFSRDYDFRYGRHQFLWPVVVFFVTVIFLTYLGLSWALAHGWSADDHGAAQIAIFSLAGAYLWVVNDLIIRARQNDMVTADINRATLRLFVAVPLGYAIAAPFAGMTSGSTAAIGTGSLAFFVGAFPTDTILKFMRRSATTVLKFDADSSGDNVRQLTTIDGITVPIAERLIDEGVNTILQLAYSDPVGLTIRSGMDFSFILDCSGQALVAIYFKEDQMKIARKFGLRGAIEVMTLNDSLSKDDKPADGQTAGNPPPPTPAQTHLKEFAKALDLDPAAARFIVDQIAEDPYTLFASKVWAQ